MPDLKQLFKYDQESDHNYEHGQIQAAEPIMKNIKSHYWLLLLNVALWGLEVIEEEQ